MNYLQQQSFLRKLIYLGIILGLFAGARVLQVYSVETQAASLGIRELDRGDVKWNESALSLMLFSFRGLVVMSLSMDANEQQEKNQLSELDMTVSLLTMLQAHHVEPWLYHSWNLAYNVAGQCDRLEDKYYFINRGLNVLARGEQRIQNQPTMRFYLGHYYQHKICECDESNVMRSLFQLSCIPPNERDPNKFRKQAPGGRWVVDLEEFQKFCEKHPVLIRRLREPPIHQRRPSDVFICRKPEDVIAFLAETKKIPNFYGDERFPVLPPERVPPAPQRVYDPSAYTATALLEDDFDGYMAARAWYCYAQEPLPDPGVQSWFAYARPEQKSDALLPGHSVAITDRRVQRQPRMTTVIFRTYPALSQAMLAERLEEEGWFDEKWEITGWFRGDDGKGKDRPLAVTGPRYGIGKSWERAYDIWKQIGQNNGLLLTKEELADLEPAAEAFRKLPESKRNVQEGEGYKADKYLRNYEVYRSLTNFTHHYLHARMESEQEAVAARKHFYDARRLLLDARPDAAQREYEKPGALPGWKSLWKRYLKEFPELAKDDLTQDDAAEIQYAYMKLVHESMEGGILLRRVLTTDCLLQAMAGPPAQPAWVSLGRLLTGRSLPGPFDDTDDNGQPLIPPGVWNSIRIRKGEAAIKPLPPPDAQAPKSPRTPK